MVYITKKKLFYYLLHKKLLIKLEKKWMLLFKSYYFTGNAFGAFYTKMMNCKENFKISKIYSLYILQIYLKSNKINP